MKESVKLLPNNAYQVTPQAAGMKPHDYALMCFAIAALLAIGVSVYFAAVNPDSFGFYHDDGIYLVTAKALAIGDGYRILSLPDEPRQTKYPPIFPLLLSFLWRLKPHFPSNLPIFFVFSTLCMLVFLALSAAFMMKHRYASAIEILLVLFLALFNWRAVILATSILSEALYAALAVGVLMLVSTANPKAITGKNLALGILLALACLTRLAGISLLATILFRALVRRQFSRFLLPLVLASSMVAGWLLLCHLHPTAPDKSYVSYYTNYFQDWRSMQQVDGTERQSSILRSVPKIAGKNVISLLANIPVVCLSAPTDWHKGMNETLLLLAILLGFFLLILLIAGFWKTRSAGSGLLHFYMLMYFALHIFWPYALYERFLIPMLPFVLLFIISGARHLLHPCIQGIRGNHHLGQMAGLAFAFIALASALSVGVFGSISGLHDQIVASKLSDAAITREKKEVFTWLKTNSRSDDILTCYQDPVYYLYADRKAIRLPAPGENEPVESYADRLQKFIVQNKITLLLRTESDFSLESQSALRRNVFANAIDSHPSDFAQVFCSTGHKIIAYRIPR